MKKLRKSTTVLPDMGKLYEVLTLHCDNYNPIPEDYSILNVIGELKYGLVYTSYKDLVESFLKSNMWFIHSLKRLKDNKTFKIGDIVYSSKCLVNLHIDRFEIPVRDNPDDQLINIVCGNRSYPLWSIEHLADVNYVKPFMDINNDILLRQGFNHLYHVIVLNNEYRLQNYLTGSLFAGSSVEVKENKGSINTKQFKELINPDIFDQFKVVSVKDIYNNCIDL